MGEKKYMILKSDASVDKYCKERNTQDERWNKNGGGFESFLTEFWESQPKQNGLFAPTK